MEIISEIELTLYVHSPILFLKGIPQYISKNHQKMMIYSGRTPFKHVILLLPHIRNIFNSVDETFHTPIPRIHASLLPRNYSKSFNNWWYLTMCDFHDFGLTFFLHNVFLHFWKCHKCVLGGCTITSKTKINVFWNVFFTPLASSGPLHSKKISKNVDFSLWGKQCIVPRKWDKNCENHT